jgi:hypothetical protein
MSYTKMRNTLRYIQLILWALVLTVAVRAQDTPAMSSLDSIGHQVRDQGSSDIVYGRP